MTITYYATIELGADDLYDLNADGSDKHGAIDAVIAELRHYRAEGNTQASGYVQVVATDSNFDEIEDESGYIDIYVGDNGELESESFDITE